jgi:hypothetical protein
VTQPQIELWPRTPWLLRLFNLTSLAPIWVGLAIGAAGYAVFLLYTAAFGPGLGRMAGLTIRNQWGAELILILLIGFAPAVTAYSVRGALRDLAALGPALDVPPARLPELHRQITTYSPAALLAVGLVSALVSTAGIVMDPSHWAGGEVPPPSHPSFIWLVARNGLNFWMISRALVLEISFARGFSRLGERLGAIDLLDPSALRPFGTRALRSVLLWMLITSFYMLLYVGSWAADVLPFALVSIALVAFATFLIPLLGAHHRIREAKQARLAELRAAIQQLAGRLLAEGSNPQPGGRLADLIAFEARIASVREWPFDASTLLRFALYLSLGLGSWLGGAVVERALDLALG